MVYERHSAAVKVVRKFDLAPVAAEQSTLPTYLISFQTSLLLLTRLQAIVQCVAVYFYYCLTQALQLVYLLTYLFT